MIKGNDLNMIALMTRGLESEIRSKITETLVAEQMAEFEKALRNRLSPLIDNIVVGKIESIRHTLKLRDELHVFIHGKEPDKESNDYTIKQR